MKLILATLCFLALATSSISARKTSVGQLSNANEVEQTQAEMTRDACDKYKIADEKMNKTYRQILREYEGQTAFIENLKKAQRAWILFRDAHFESVYPDPNKLAAYGSVNPMCQCITLTELANQRTEVLKRWIDGIAEGDVCSGSIRRRKEQ